MSRKKYNLICTILLMITYACCIVHGFMQSIDNGLMWIATCFAAYFAYLYIVNYESND